MIGPTAASFPETELAWVHERVTRFAAATPSADRRSGRFAAMFRRSRRTGPMPPRRAVRRAA